MSCFDPEKSWSAALVAPASAELVAGTGPLDHPSDEPAPTQGHARKHVLARVAPDVGLRGGSVVRPPLGQTPHLGSHGPRSSRSLASQASPRVDSKGCPRSEPAASTEAFTQPRGSGSGTPLNLGRALAPSTISGTGRCGRAHLTFAASAVSLGNHETGAAFTYSTSPRLERRHASSPRVRRATRDQGQDEYLDRTTSGVRAFPIVEALSRAVGSRAVAVSPTRCVGVRSADGDVARLGRLSALAVGHFDREHERSSGGRDAGDGDRR